MRASGMQPLEPYVNASTPWRSQCSTCGAITSPRLSSIRSGQGGCRACGYKRNGKASRIPEDQAISEMRDAGLEPLVPYPGINKPWQCACTTCGTVGTPRLASIRRGQGGCTPCGHVRGGLAIRISESEAISTMRAANLEPLVPYPGARTAWKSRCTVCGTIGHPWLSSIRNEVGGCKPCGVAKVAASQRVPEGQAIADMRAAGMEPVEPYPNSAQAPWKCRCTICGTIGTPRLSNVRGGNGGCRPCGRAKAAASMRIPEAVAVAEMRAAGMEPVSPYPNSVMEPWECRCTACGTHGRPRLFSIRRGQGGCVRCGIASSAAVRRRPENLAIAEMRAAGLEPLDPYKASDEPWRCRCNVCGAIGAPRLVSIRNGNGGCNACGRILAALSCRVPEEQAIAEMRAKDLEPLDPYPGAHAPWRCRCTCGTIGSPRLVAIRAGQGGCRSCAPYGFDWDGPAIIYLLAHEELGAHKLGITGVATKRLANFKNDGWQVFRTIPMINGAAAWTVEQRVLTTLTSEGVGTSFLSRVAMPRGGYTETIDAEALSLLDLEHLVRQEIAKLFDDPCPGALPLAC